ncbi:MAG: cytochrome P450 [Actinomycetota bacterium]|jgi:cytochrome P450|nr:cytochrome P450 [Actinomycetota bacterium]MDA8280727.1 cytochrome P450 [Actinomycetota bacterium]
MSQTTPPHVDGIDLSDAAFWTEPWPERYAAFAALRALPYLPHFDDPVLEGALADMLPPGNGYYAVTRHADVVEASRHPERFCSGQGATSIFDMPREMLEYFGGMINEDDPRHSRLRRIVSNAFNPRRVRAIEDGIERVATDLVDRLLQLGSCDFVPEVAAALPLAIICDMMGVRESDRQTVFEASNVILSNGDPDFIPEGADPIAAFLKAGATLSELMEDLARERLARPTDDITSALVNANVDGEALAHDELASFFILLVVAGNETTRNAISHGLLALTEHPDQRAIWAADLDGVTGTAVEEIVRWASPVIFMRRTTTIDTVLGGQQLHAGDKLLLVYPSANRDETVFEQPEHFDIRRQPNPHVGFGGAGPHFCLGAHLARREIDVMFRQLLTRAPHLAATGVPDRLQSSFINGIKHLPCDVQALSS